MHVFFSIGEPSGDQHAAHLIQELRRRDPQCRATGFGGPEMLAHGQEQLYPLAEHAVMGIAAVLPLLKTFHRLYHAARLFMERDRPDAVLLIDYPGFNWWIAKAAKRLGIPVYYYCPPQLWAWGGWRISKVRKYVDCILSVLPFEADWYRQRHVPVEYVGHPFFDEVSEKPLDQAFCQTIAAQPGRKVCILPGSRRQEVELNFPVQLQVVRLLHDRHPDVTWRVACYKQKQRDFCQAVLNDRGAGLPVELHTGRTSELIETADICLQVSGSVSLELLARGKPAVVMYRGGMTFGLLAKALARCQHMSITNLLANRRVLPEFPFIISPDARAQDISRPLDEWLSDPGQLAELTREVVAIRDRSATRGSSSRAAEVLLRGLARTSQSPGDQTRQRPGDQTGETQGTPAARSAVPTVQGTTQPDRTDRHAA